MPFEKKREKQIQILLPAVKFFQHRTIHASTEDISDALGKKKEFVPESRNPSNYSLDSDSEDYEESDDY